MAFTRFSTLLVSSRLFFSADNSNCTERSLMKVSKAYDNSIFILTFINLTLICYSIEGFLSVESILTIKQLFNSTLLTMEEPRVF